MADEGGQVSEEWTGVIVITDVEGIKVVCEGWRGVP